MPAHTLRLLLDARASRRGEAEGLARRQRDRLAEMVRHARTSSPYYRRHYQGLPAHITDPQLLPATAKAELMVHFDEWVTDPAVTLADVEAFVADPALIGHQLLGRYTVATTSGTTGVRGLFLVDDRSMAVTSAMAWRMLTDWLTPADLARILTRGGRLAMVVATGGHFASGAAAAGLRRGRAASRIGAFSVQDPVPQLVAQLNAFDPAVLAPYASTLRLLTDEQEAGRLHIHPALVVPAAEGLPDREYARIAAAFGALVRHSYAATECPFLSYSCTEGWLHVNSDWVLLEPVDADHRPLPEGGLLDPRRVRETTELDEAGVTRALRTIERNARAQTRIIEDLLDMSRIISGKVRLEVVSSTRPRPVAANVSVDQALASLGIADPYRDMAA